MLSLLADRCDYCNYGYHGNHHSKKVGLALHCSAVSTILYCVSKITLVQHLDTERLWICPPHVQEISHVLRNMMANLPEAFRIVVDSTTDDGSSSVGLVWHAELNRMRMLNGQVSMHLSHT